MLRESPLIHGLPESNSLTLISTEAVSAKWMEARAELLNALLTVNLRKAHVLVNTISIMHPTETIISEIFNPILITIGERWQLGQITIAEEHLVSNFIRQRLLALSQLFAPFAHGPRLICACAPHEQHELGLLMFAVLMEQRGWEVIYLGQDLPADGLSKIVAQVTPVVLCVTFSMAEHLPGIFDIAQELKDFDSQQMVFAYTGRAFTQNPELRSKLPGTFLGHSFQEAVQKLDELGEQLDRERWLMASWGPEYQMATHAEARYPH